MKVKHKESGNEYKVYDISKEKSGTYILMYKMRFIYKDDKMLEKWEWVWGDIDDYEPVTKYDICYTCGIKISEHFCKNCNAGYCEECEQDYLRYSEILKGDICSDGSCINSNELQIEDENYLKELNETIEIEDDKK